MIKCFPNYFAIDTNGLFPPTETDADSDSKPYRYIVLCTTFSTGMDSDSDPCMESFPDGYCTHLGTEIHLHTAQGQISVPILL